jgi:pimeloyl-ACP methyl ester carboxylesterase
MTTSRFVHRQLLPALIAASLSSTSLMSIAANIEPNPHLTATGIPPITQAIADRAAQYNDFRPRALLGWHPKQRWMLISTRTKGATAQLHLLRKAKGELEQLTDFPDPVRKAFFEPRKGDYIVFEKDEGGNEANQLYRLDLDAAKSGKSGKPGKQGITLLTATTEKHEAGPWNHGGDLLIVGSIALDKTATGGKRNEINTDVSLLDPKQPQARRKLVSLPGGGWNQFAWSHDDKTIVATNYKSANESEVWLIDVASGKARQILPTAEQAKQGVVNYSQTHFSSDDKSLILTSDQAGEFQQTIKLDLETLQSTTWTGHIQWDVDELHFAAKGRQLAAIVNREGLNELHLFDAGSGKELKTPALPTGAVEHLAWHKNATDLGFSLNNAQSPGEVVVLNLKTGKTEVWTTPHPNGVDTSKLPTTEIIRWNSFDQRSISGLISRPAKDKFTGPRPVLILIHGGPEAQAKLSFLGRFNYLPAELGITLIQPNVRGSSGFGKSFLKLDNGMLREDSVKDIGALLDWIGTQPDLDPKRVMVAGGSYGGYMSLAASTWYADRIVGAIDSVGISHFVTFLERTESYRRDLRRVEYGDERIPEMRAFMEKIAPLNNAQKITKPLFVIQGKNDPRVPVNEAEQIVAKVQKNNTPVWYLVADNEGHGFRKRDNADFSFFAQIKFMQEYLLK